MTFFRSIRSRLLALAALSIGGALVLAWLLLSQLFEQRIALRVFAELETHLEQLARVVEPGPDGGIELSGEPDEPRFARPFSGLYWQIFTREDVGQEILASNSLWDESLTMPEEWAPLGEIRRHQILPHLDDTIMAVERILYLSADTGEVPIRMVVAADRAELEIARRDFADRVLMLVAVLGAFLLLASMVQAFFGLRPLGYLRTRLNDVRDGKAQRLQGKFPTEVQALVDELNGLLAGREEMVARARARAADLAHGLKTPLAVLAAESRRLAGQGDAETAAEITAQIDRMNRNVERELVRARTRGSDGTLVGPLPLRAAVDRLMRAFGRMTEGDGISWTSSVGEDLAIAMDPVDFDEVLGTLMDNARKWARSRVQIAAHLQNGAVTLAIADDGPGVPAAERQHVLERGQRLDQATPGTGLGLTITTDILELYGGRLHLGDAPIGGLLVSVTLPTSTAVGAPA